MEQEELEILDDEEYDGDDETGEVTAEEEQRFQSIIIKQKGQQSKNPIVRYLKEIGQFAVLERDEEIALAKAIANGDKQAREKLVNHNLRLVVALAKKYIGELEFDELIAQGNMGLLMAVDKYNWEIGTKFATYAAFWIKLEIEKGIQMKKNMVSKPTHIISAMRAISVVSRGIEASLHKQPTPDEISRAMDGKFTPEQVSELVLMMTNSATISLDKKVGDSEDDDTLSDMIPDESSGQPDSAMMMDEKRNAIAEALACLREQEKITIQLRYGWGCDREHTLDEVAVALHAKGYANKKGEPYSKEYVRQLEEKALAKLRKSPQILALMG